MAVSTATPLARSQGLVVEELGDELLVYDLETDHAHSLGPEAAKVWRCCDGRTPVNVLRRQVELEAETVDRALEELAACDLLTTATHPAMGSTRRELTVKMAKLGAAVAAAPLIVSVTAPPAWAQRTVRFCEQACPPPCTSGNCGSCCTAAFAGCCCCVGNPPGGGGADKFCVPGVPGDNSATCVSLHPVGGFHCSCYGTAP
jgi:hypothetical protein